MTKQGSPPIGAQYATHDLKMMNRIIQRPDGTPERPGNLTLAEIRSWIVRPLATLIANAEAMLIALPDEPPSA